MATNLGTEPGKKRRRRRTLTATRPRYGNRQQVKGGVRQRAQRRLEATGPIKGVSTEGGITGREARKIRRVHRQGVRDPRSRPKQPSRPRQPLDPFAREVEAETNLRYGGQERQLGYRREQEQQFGQAQQGWFQTYQNEVKSARDRQAAYAQGFQAAAYQQANTAAAGDQQANQQLLQQQQDQATQRGAQVDPQLAATLQQGTAARQVMGSAGGDLLGAQGQAQTAYLGNRVGVAAERGIQAGQQSQARERRVAELAEQLAADKGEYRVKTRRELEDIEHKQGLERAAFGLDVEQERNDQRQALRDDRRQAKSDRALRRDRRIDNRRMERAEQRQERESQSRIRDRIEDNRRQDLADDGKRNGSAKYTQSQRNSNQAAYRKGRSAASQLGKGFSPKEKMQVLTGKENIDPLIARAIVAPGTLTPRQREELRRMGIRVGGSRRGTIVRPPSAPAPGGDRPT